MDGTRRGAHYGPLFMFAILFGLSMDYHDQAAVMVGSLAGPPNSPAQ